MERDSFYQLVASMRRMQNKYFATKDKQYLIASKAAEKKVDDELRAEGYNTVSPEDRKQQPSLF